MAQEVITRLVDDLDGSEAEETLRFALDGTTYEIDLNAKNAAALRKALDKYVAAARKSGGGGARRGRPAARRPSGKGEADPRAVRVWAGENKIKLSPRGRIPADVIAQYKAATRR